MTLIVERLRTHLRTLVPIAPARLEGWHAALAAQNDAALGAGLVRDDEWLLIRRLRISTQWSADAADSDVGARWGQTLRGAIENALANRGTDTIHYPNRHAAIADMLYRGALRQLTRRWAWHRMGLIAHAESRAEEVLDSAVSLLVTTPALIWPVLQRIIAAEEETAALTAVLRALSPSHWTRLLAASPRTGPYVRWIGKPAHDEFAPGSDADRSALQASAGARKLFAWAATRTYVVERHAEALAVLLAALVWPAEGARDKIAQRRLSLALASLVPAIAATPAVRAPAGSRSASRRVQDARPGIDRKHLRVVEETDATLEQQPPELPDLPDPAVWQSTAFAGALFWLGRIAASGALAWLEQDDAPADGLRLFLREVARALGVPDDDNALTAFCGGHVPRSEAPEAFTLRAAALVASWRAWLDEAAPQLAEPRLLAVCRRDGRLRMESGWIELHLALMSVDTAIRRLGLDLDPGFLPWLGCVLRICYDE